MSTVYIRKMLTPRGLVWDTNKAAVKDTSVALFYALRNDVKEGASTFTFLLTVEEKTIANQPGDDHQLE